MTIKDVGNVTVTDAIYGADSAIDDAIRAYERLLQAEAQLFQSPGLSESEREIALRGTGEARYNLFLLRQMQRAP